MSGTGMHTTGSQYQLLVERRFAPFFVVQFLGAMNDNVFKQALVILLAYQSAHLTTLSPDLLQNIAQALFILPFFLFSATSGQLADKFEKSTLITITVAIELAVMAMGAVGLLTSSLWMLLGALFLGGVQSTLFGPVKYAILPQVLDESELVGGNGLVEMGTSVAILVGMMIGGWLMSQPDWGVKAVAVATCAFSALGILASLFIPKAPAVAPELRINWNPLTETVRNLAFTRTNRTVYLSVLGISWFWFYGAILLTQFPSLSKNVLQAPESVVTLLLMVFSVGIGAGSLLCERLSGHKVELGLVPFGSIGMTLFGVDLWLSTSQAFAASADMASFARSAGGLWVLADLFMIGLFGGFYIVPLYALIQARSEPSHRSRVVAGNNILNAIFMVAAAAMAIGLFAAGLGIPELILVVALMNAAVAMYIYRLVPEFLMRFMTWILVHSVYRLDKGGLEHIPDEGPAVLVCNHVSYVDALVVSAACRRPIRWVMDHRIYATPGLRFFFRTVRAIPIAPEKESPETLQAAYDEISAALAAGELVGVFPEGRLTTDGEMSPFRAGITRILARDPVPVVPMALQGLWQSLFARSRDKLRHIGRLFPKVGLRVAPPVLPQEATPERLQELVGALRAGLR